MYEKLLHTGAKITKDPGKSRRMDSTAHLRKGLTKSKQNVFTDSMHIQLLQWLQHRRANPAGSNILLNRPPKSWSNWMPQKPEDFRHHVTLPFPEKKFHETVGPLHFDALREENKKHTHHNDLKITQTNKKLKCLSLCAHTSTIYKLQSESSRCWNFCSL